MILEQWFRNVLLCLALVMSAQAIQAKTRYIMYLTGQHNVVPESDLVSKITHVALAFMRSDAFNTPNQTTWPLFTNVSDVRLKFADGTKIMVAIGGWGDTNGFEAGALTKESQRIFAENVKAMVDAVGADGVDVDWEYPGHVILQILGDGKLTHRRGNGEDYKTNPNSNKTWQITAYPELLAEIRAALGRSKVISAAIPGLPRDMIAFTPDTIPSIMDSVDFLNIMTYDLMNRRDNVTKHHTGLQLSLESFDAYLGRGVPLNKANLGLAFYVKWFYTAPDVDCSAHPVGCKTALMEDPVTGADLGQAGGFSWHDTVPADVEASFNRAKEQGVYDEEGGGYYFWDAEERRFWTWDVPAAINRKLAVFAKEKKPGGVFAWGLGEDAPEFAHLKAANGALEKAFWGGRQARRQQLREL